MNEPIADPSSGPGYRERISKLRDSLLVLHKALLDSERIQYEQAFGTIHSPYEFLQRVISDPWFAWLHPLSEFLVFMDETLEREEPLQLQEMTTIRNHVRNLLVASEEGQGFPRSYFEALQREPDVVLAHAQVVKLLNAWQ